MTQEEQWERVIRARVEDMRANPAKYTDVTEELLRRIQDSINVMQENALRMRAAAAQVAASLNRINQIRGKGPQYAAGGMLTGPRRVRPVDRYTVTFDETKGGRW